MLKAFGLGLGSYNCCLGLKGPGFGHGVKGGGLSLRFLNWLHHRLRSSRHQVELLLQRAVERRTGGDFWETTAPRTTWPELSGRAGVATTPGRCFTRYTGFQWGSGSPMKWLFWLTRCGPQPLQRISASWYRPVHQLGFCALPMLVVPRIHTELALRAFSVAAPFTWNSLPADIRLCKIILTFKRHLKTLLFKLT